MKKKYKQVSKTTLSVVLALMMLVSSVVVGNSATITDQMLTDETTEQVETAAQTTQADADSAEADEEAEAAAAPEGETSYTEGTWSTTPKEASVEEETTVQDTKKSVPVTASGAALDVQASGTNSGWYILGAYIGTSNANTADCWADARGVAFTNEKSYTSGTSTVYYEDIYVTNGTNRSEIKLHNSNASPAWRNSTNMYLNAYEWNSEFDYSKNDSLYKDGKEVNPAWYGNSGKFRAMFNTGTNKLSFRSLDLSIYGANVWTEENGTNSNWNIANAISLDTKASDTDYYTTVYIVNNSKFKFYAPTTTAYFGANSTYTFEANETKKAPDKMGNSDASGSSFAWGGETGTYEVHYNPCTYEIWFKEIAESFDITNNSSGIITIASNANSTSTVNFTTTGPAKITAVDGDGNNVTILQTAANAYKFTMPNSNVTISATAVTAGSVNVKAVVAGGSGNVTGLSSTATLGTSVTDSKVIGSKVTLNASANSGYNFSKWRVSGTYGEDYYLGSSTMTSTSIDIYPITSVTVKAVFSEDVGTEQAMYILYNYNDQYMYTSNANNDDKKPKSSRVYKKTATTESSDYRIGDYVYYTDIAISQSGDFYFNLSSSTLMTNSYVQKTSAVVTVSDCSISTSDSSLITVYSTFASDYNNSVNSKSYGISHCGIGSGVGKIRIYLKGTSEPSGKSFVVVPNPESNTSANSVKVYAKNGTIRNADFWHSAKNDGTYNKYAALAETTIDYVNIEDGEMTENRDFNNLCQVETVEKGKTIRITTKINNANKNKYYVKAFCINGFAFGTINEPKPTDPKRTSGVYTYDYTVPLDSPDKVEITPIYFYLTDSASDNGDNRYITFYAEDFVTATDKSGVKDKWGNTIFLPVAIFVLSGIKWAADSDFCEKLSR